MKESEIKEDILRCTGVIDRVTNEIVIPYSEMSDIAISERFKQVFPHKKEDLVEHYISKFVFNSKKDFGGYFFSCEVDLIRAFFVYHNIPMEADKFTKKENLMMAQIMGKNRFEIFPFEYQVIYLFFLMAGNNSIELLQDLLPEALDRVKGRQMSLYGNGFNWSVVWQILLQNEKEILADFIINRFKG